MEGDNVIHEDAHALGNLRRTRDRVLNICGQMWALQIIARGESPRPGSSEVGAGALEDT